MISELVGEHVTISECWESDSGLTRYYRVIGTQNSLMLGYVDWHISKECYVFKPNRTIVFDAQYLADLASFLKQLMEDRRGAIQP